MKDRIMNILFYPKEELLPLTFDLNLCFGPPWCKVQTTQYFKFYRGPRKKGPKKFLFKEMLWLWSSLCIIKSKKSPKSEKKYRYSWFHIKGTWSVHAFKETIYLSLSAQLAVGSFFMKYPVAPKKISTARTWAKNMVTLTMYNTENGFIGHIYTKENFFFHCPINRHLHFHLMHSQVGGSLVIQQAQFPHLWCGNWAPENFRSLIRGIILKWIFFNILSRKLGKNVNLFT